MTANAFWKLSQSYAEKELRETLYISNKMDSSYSNSHWRTGTDRY